MEQYETRNFVVFSDEHGAHGGHGVHVAGWQYDYVKTPLLITIFLIIAAYFETRLPPYRLSFQVYARIMVSYLQQRLNLNKIS